MNEMMRNAKRAETLLKLIANQKRLMILCHLVDTEKSVGELSSLVDLSYSALSQHLGKMKEQGIVDGKKEGKQVFYTLSNPEAKAILSTLYTLYCRKRS